MTREQKIQERLGKATPGPWKAENGTYVHAGSFVITADKEGMNSATPLARISDFDDGAAHDANFIAHAPDDITYLLARVEELEADVLHWKEHVDLQANDASNKLIQISHLRAQLTAAQAINAQRDARLVRAEQVAADQANDDGLWFIATSATEAYLQQELRKLHAAIEGTDDFGNALATDDAAIAAKIGEKP
jgi:hypothetical protein